jgi:hypothetical protein
MTRKQPSGLMIIVYSQTYFDISYPDLAQWTKSLPNAARSCFVTFGRNLSYFACAPGHGSIWAGIPSELEDTVRKSLDTPCYVSLGMKNAWFVSYPDGRVVWKFHGHYSPLNKILIDAAPGSVTVSLKTRSYYKGIKADVSRSMLPSRRTTRSTTLLRFEIELSSTTSKMPLRNGDV